jgi:hypothetical protein
MQLQFLKKPFDVIKWLRVCIKLKSAEDVQCNFVRVQSRGLHLGVGNHADLINFDSDWF